MQIFLLSQVRLLRTVDNFEYIKIHHRQLFTYLFTFDLFHTLNNFKIFKVDMSGFYFLKRIFQDWVCSSVDKVQAQNPGFNPNIA